MSCPFPILTVPVPSPLASDASSPLFSNNGSIFASDGGSMDIDSESDYDDGNKIEDIKDEEPLCTIQEAGLDEGIAVEHDPETPLRPYLPMRPIPQLSTPSRSIDSTKEITNNSSGKNMSMIQPQLAHYNNTLPITFILMRPPIYKPALNSRNVAGQMTLNQFNQVFWTFLTTLSLQKRFKAVINLPLSRAIRHALLAPPKQAGPKGASQFRYWARNNFSLQKKAERDKGDGMKGDRLEHEGRTVALREEFYELLTRAHAPGEDGKHVGRDKAMAEIRTTYSYLPKELVGMFIKACPTCYERHAKGYFEELQERVDEAIDNGEAVISIPPAFRDKGCDWDDEEQEIRVNVSAHRKKASRPTIIPERKSKKPNTVDVSKLSSSKKIEPSSIFVDIPNKIKHVESSGAMLSHSESGKISLPSSTGSSKPDRPKSHKRKFKAIRPLADPQPTASTTRVSKGLLDYTLEAERTQDVDECIYSALGLDLAPTKQRKARPSPLLVFTAAEPVLKPAVDSPTLSLPALPEMIVEDYEPVRPIDESMWDRRSPVMIDTCLSPDMGGPFDAELSSPSPTTPYLELPQTWPESATTLDNMDVDSLPQLIAEMQGLDLETIKGDYHKTVSASPLSQCHTPLIQDEVEELPECDFKQYVEAIAETPTSALLLSSQSTILAKRGGIRRGKAKNPRTSSVKDYHASAYSEASQRLRSLESNLKTRSLIRRGNANHSHDRGMTKKRQSADISYGNLSWDQRVLDWSFMSPPDCAGADQYLTRDTLATEVSTSDDPYITEENPFERGFEATVWVFHPAIRKSPDTRTEYESLSPGEGEELKLALIGSN